MKECNYGRIPPCYGSLERAIYEEAKKVNDEWKKSRARHGKMIDKMRAKLMEGGFADDTHDKVYELNKQMCDIGKTILTKKKNDMEEKKTIEDGFSYDKVVELAKPLMHYLNEVGFQDSIRVSQLGIIHEPMSTLIFDNGIGE